MKYKLLLTKIKNIIEHAGAEMAVSLNENLDAMHWEIGFELRKIKNIKKVATKLAKDLAIDPELFEISLEFYKNTQGDEK